MHPPRNKFESTYPLSEFVLLVYTRVRTQRIIYEAFRPRLVSYLEISRVSPDTEGSYCSCRIGLRKGYIRDT